MTRSMAMGCALTGALVGFYGQAKAESDDLTASAVEAADAAEAEAKGEAEAEGRPIGFGMTPFTVEASRAQVELKAADVSWVHEGDATARKLSLGGFDLKLGVTDRIDAELGFQPWIQTDAGEGEGWSSRAIGDTTMRLKINLTGYGGTFTAAAVPYVVIATAGEGMGNESTAVGVAVPMAFALPGHFELGAGVEAVTVPVAGMDDDVDLAFNLLLGHAITSRVGGFVEGVVASHVRDAHAEYTAHAGSCVSLADDAQLAVAVKVDPTAPADRVNPYVALIVRH